MKSRTNKHAREGSAEPSAGKRQPSERAARKPRKSTRYMPVTDLPSGVRMDQCIATECCDDSLCDAGILRGDAILLLRTANVRRGDFACVETPDGMFARRYRPRRGGQVTLEPLNRKYASSTYRRDEVTVIGRVMRVERDGKIVRDLRIELRAPTDAERGRTDAELYDFPEIVEVE